MSGRPSERHLVLRSIEAPGGDRCVDIFRRDDGSFGFEGYRRDVEDASGWYGASGYAALKFASEPEAYSAAERVCPWIGDIG